MKIKTVSIFIFYFIICMVLGWYGGADFTVRSVENALFVVLSLAFSMTFTGMTVNI